MYLQNKYTRIYFSIIYNAKNRILDGYQEKHHIVPQSLGGSHDKDNIVSLTAREHFICHLLLTRMVEGKSKSKMYQASWMMASTVGKGQDRYKVNNRTYEFLRLKMSQVKKSTTTWNKGVSPSEETRLKLRAASLDKLVKSGKMSIEEAEQKKTLPLLPIGSPKPRLKKEKTTNIRKDRRGWKWSDEAKERLSQQRMGRTPWNKGKKKTTI